MNMLLFVVAIIIGFVVSALLLKALSWRRAKAEEKVLKGYFLLGLSGLMAKIAEADGTVSTDELELAVNYFKKMKLTDSEKALCIGNFVTSRRNQETVRDLAKRFLAYAQPAACEFLYYLLWRISAADGVLDPAEDKLLKEIGTYLGQSEAQYDRLKGGAHPTFSAATLLAAGVPKSLVALA